MLNNILNNSQGKIMIRRLKQFVVFGGCDLKGKAEESNRQNATMTTAHGWEIENSDRNRF